MNIDSADLILFACIADEGSFSRAADKLNIPGSTVSRRMQNLENQLGERLINRTTRKMVLTDFGYAVLNHARQIAAEMEATIALTDSRKRVPTGKLRISMPGDFTQDMIGKLLADFINSFPSVSLEIDVSQRRVDIIGENFDLALRLGLLQNDATLVARSIGAFRVGLYAAPSYLVKSAKIHEPFQLMQHSTLKLQSQFGMSEPWLLVRDTQIWKDSPPIKASANSPSILVNLALSGAGITSLATHFARPYIENGTLVRVLPEWECPAIPVWAVFPGRRLLAAKTRVFIDFLVTNFSDFKSDELIL